MTKEQKQHMERVLLGFEIRMQGKYERGVDEHGGNLWETSLVHLLEEALDENVDQFVYLYTALQKAKGELP